MFLRARATSNEVSCGTVTEGHDRDFAGDRLSRARVGRWMLASAIAGAALAVGTVHTGTLCVVTGVLAMATVFTWWDAEAGPLPSTRSSDASADSNT